MEKGIVKVLLLMVFAAVCVHNHRANAENGGGTNIALPNLDFAQENKAWILRDTSKLGGVYRAANTPEGTAAIAVHIDEKSAARLANSAYIARRDFPVDAGYYQLQFRASSDLTRGNAGWHILAQQENDFYAQIVNIGQGGAPTIQGKTSWTNYFVLYKIPEKIKTVVAQFEVNNAHGNVTVADISLHKLDAKTGAKLMQRINPQVSSAEEYGVKMVATPSRTINAIGRKMLYQPPGMDHPILVINSCTPGEIGSAIFVDYIANKSTVIPLPHGSGGWDIIETAPGKLLFESLSPLHLITIDTTNGDYKVISDVAAGGGNTYAWRFAKGADGTIYFGSYPTCHVYSYSPKTEKITDLGHIGPEGNLYVRHVGVDNRGFLLCSVGVSKPNVVAYNLKTGTQTIVAAGKSGMLHQIGGHVYVPINGQLQKFDAAQMKFNPIISPAPPQDLHWRLMSENSTLERMVIQASDMNWYLCESNQPPREIWDMDLKGGTVIGIDSNDHIVGLRGQEYFVAQPNSQEVQFHLVAEKPVPVSIHFITADPAGGVTGGPSFGQTLFRYDGARNLEQNTGQVADGGGEVYDGKWLNGIFYYVAYAGGYMGEWNPHQPWDQNHNVNPQIRQQYNTKKWGQLIRPIGGVVIGPENKLYTGWSAEYGVQGGGLTEFNPATGESRVWTNEIFADKMSIGTVATDGKYIYGVTANHFSGINPAPKPIVFWAFDPATEKVLFKHQLEIMGGAQVFVVPATKHIWLTDASGMQRFDATKLSFVQSIKWPKEIGGAANVTSADARDNRAWMFVGNKIIRLIDDGNPQLKVLFQTKITGNIAAGYDGNLYYTQKSQLWAVALDKHTQ